MATVNIEQFKKSIAASNPQLQILAYGTALSKFNSKKRELLKEFDEHPITEELAAGPDAPTNVLSDGNLYSFLGFDAGTDVIGPLRKELEDINLDKNPKRTIVGNVYSYEFNVNEPDRADIAAATPMPSWSSGSWAEKIEKGISGFQSYIFGVFNSSRSGTGLQLPGKVRSETFKAKKYITQLLKDFRNKFNT